MSSAMSFALGKTCPHHQAVAEMRVLVEYGQHNIGPPRRRSGKEGGDSWPWSGEVHEVVHD